MDEWVNGRIILCSTFPSSYHSFTQSYVLNLTATADHALDNPGHDANDERLSRTACCSTCDENKN